MNINHSEYVMKYFTEIINDNIKTIAPIDVFSNDINHELQNLLLVRYMQNT